VHGKGSLMGKMPGDDWQKFANMRLLFGYLYAHPGKKLFFMGAELGQRREWNHETSLDWHLLEYAPHAGIRRWVQHLNILYRGERALHELDFDPAGFEWVDFSDADNSVITAQGNERYTVLGLSHTRASATIAWRSHGRILKELLNSDAPEYGGSDRGTSAVWRPRRCRPMVPPSLTLLPFGMVFQETG
jgi:1,4-alpha-glucan branching enzyme